MPTADYADFGITQFTPSGEPIMPGDDKLLVQFFLLPRLSIAQTNANGGSQVYENVEMVKVIQPGEKEAVTVAVQDIHRARFPRHYDAFKRGLDQQKLGTPLEIAFPTSPDMIATLKAANIFSIEQLAGLSDSSMQNIPFGRTLCDKAKAYLASASGGKEFHAMQQQIDELTAKLAAMRSEKEDGLKPVPQAELGVNDEAARDAAETVAARMAPPPLQRLQRPAR